MGFMNRGMQSNKQKKAVRFIIILVIVAFLASIVSMAFI